MTPRRGIGPNVVTALAVLGLLGAMVFLMGSVDRQAGQVAQLSTNNDALRSQVQSQGETPVAPPAETITGKAGSDGATGLTGARGRAPTATEIREQVAAYCSFRLDCQGDTGAVSTTPGPAGAEGPMGPASTVPGQDGGDGQDGADGTDGAAGATGAASTVPGPTGQSPTSWTFTDATGTQQECTRTEPYDPAAPTYSCAAQPTGVTP